MHTTIHTDRQRHRHTGRHTDEQHEQQTNRQPKNHASKQTTGQTATQKRQSKKRKRNPQKTHQGQQNTTQTHARQPYTSTHSTRPTHNSTRLLMWCARALAPHLLRPETPRRANCRPSAKSLRAPRRPQPRTKSQMAARRQAADYPRQTRRAFDKANTTLAQGRAPILRGRPRWKKSSHRPAVSAVMR